LLVDPADFHWLNGEEWVGRYEVEDAKHFATSFCKQCGSSLPWLGKSGKAVVIPAGSLDDDPQIRPSRVHSNFTKATKQLNLMQPLSGAG
jgi:hypothetical protein